MFLSGLDYRMGPSYGVVITDDEVSDTGPDMLDELDKIFAPNMVVVLNHDASWLQDNLENLAQKGLIDNMTTAYVCGHGTCFPPVRSVEGLLAIFEK
jgi:uncharacterized protein YyaL (SSP411 family)